VSFRLGDGRCGVEVEAEVVRVGGGVVGGSNFVASKCEFVG